MHIFLTYGSVIVWDKRLVRATVGRSLVSIRATRNREPQEMRSLEAPRTVRCLSTPVRRPRSWTLRSWTLVGRSPQSYNSISASCPGVTYVTAVLLMWISSRVAVGFDLLLLTGPCSAESDARVLYSPLQFPRRPQRSGGYHTAAVPPLELAHCVANLR